MQARSVGFEPTPCVLEAHCSPRSTILSISGRDRGRTCKPFRVGRLAGGCRRRLSAGPSVCSCPGRTRTCNRSVNSGLLYHLSYKAIIVSVAGFEPALSSAPCWRIGQLSHTLKTSRTSRGSVLVNTTGVEPVRSHLKCDVLPLDNMFVGFRRWVRGRASSGSRTHTSTMAR